MKIIRGVSYLILSALLFVSTDSAILPVSTKIFQPVEGEEHEQERLKWIETIHRTAPGVDWRAMDEQVRWEKYREKLPRLKSNTSGDENIAGGLLTGRWIEKGSRNQAGRMHCVDIDFEEGKVYGASSGGNIWTGTLKGENWTCLTNHKQVKNVQFLRVFKMDDGHRRIMMAPRNTLLFYYSDDMGLTWRLGRGMENYRRNGYFIRAVTHPDGTIYLLMSQNGQTNYIFRSTDYGETFTRIVKMEHAAIYSDIWTNRFGNGNIYYVDRNQCYRLNESDKPELVGQINLSFSVKDIKQVQLAGCVTDTADFLYVMYKLDKSTRFFGSDNGGVSWSSRGENNEKAFMSNSFGVSNVNPNLLGFGGVNAYSSRDGARTWRAVNKWSEYYGDVKYRLHADIPEIEFFLKPDGSETVWISTDGGTFYSTDGMQSVSNVSLSGLNVSQYYSTYTIRDKPDYIFAGSQDQGFQQTFEEGEGPVNFRQTISGDYGHIVSANGGYSLWTVYPGFAMYYPDAISAGINMTWSFTGSNHFWMPPLMEDPYNADKVYLAGGTSSTGNHLWYLYIQGGEIAVTELPYDFSGGNENNWISAMAYSMINKDYRYVLNSGGQFFFSSDAGNNWEKSGDLGPRAHYFYGNSILASPVDINTIYLAGSGYSSASVYRSEDGGVSFSPMSNGLPHTLVFEIKSNEDGSLLFAATETGPYVYIASEDQWFDLSGLAAPDQTYWSVDYVPVIHTARFGTYGRGIWDFQIGTFLGTGENSRLTDASQGIFRCYPNPVNDELHIVLPENYGRLHYEVFHIDGHLVYTGEIRPGNKEIRILTGEWQAGVYLIRMTERQRTQVVRVVKSGRH